MSRTLVLQQTSPRSVVSLFMMLLAALLLWGVTATNAGAFEYLEVPEDCQVIDELNPFPDLSDWNLVEEKDMGVMEDNSIRMCRRKTFIQEQSNRRLYVVYFKGEPELYWYNVPEVGDTNSQGVAEMFGGGGKGDPNDPTKASDYREQSKKSFDMGFGLLRF